MKLSTPEFLATARAQEMLLMKELTGKKVVGGVYLLMISVNDIFDNLRLGEYGTAEKAPAQPGFELGEDGALKRTHDPQNRYCSNLVPRSTWRFYTVEVVNSRLRILLQTMPRFVNVLRRFGIQPKAANAKPDPWLVRGRNNRARSAAYEGPDQGNSRRGL